ERARDGLGSGLMDGFFTQLLKAIGVEPRVYKGSFEHDGGTGDPSAYSYPVGLKPTVTRSATGTFSVALPEGCGTPAQPHAIVLTANPDSASDWFEACQVGESDLNTASRSFTVLTHRGGTALDPTGRVGF